MCRQGEGQLATPLSACVSVFVDVCVCVCVCVSVFRAPAWTPCAGWVSACCVWAWCVRRVGVRVLCVGMARALGVRVLCVGLVRLGHTAAHGLFAHSPVTMHAALVPGTTLHAEWHC